MNNYDKIFYSETIFCESFSKLEIFDFGRIYYNKNIPESHDSNHSYIENFNNIDNSIKTITKFYEQYNISPRIKARFLENELEILSPLLILNNYSIVESKDAEYFIFPKKRSSKKN